MIEIISIEDIVKDIKDSQYKRVSLLDNNGKQLVPFNGKGVPVEERLSVVESTVKSKGIADGIYQIHAKHHGNNAVASIYYTQKGDKSLAEIEIKAKEVEIIQPPVPTIEAVPVSKAVGYVTIEEHNKMYQAKLQTEFKVKELESQITRLNDYIDELEDQAEEPTKGLLSDNTQSFLSQTIENLTPLFDKMMEQKDVSQRLEFMRMQQNQQPQVQQQRPPVQQQQTTPGHLEEEGEISVEEEEQLDAMELMKEQNPELYELSMQRLNQYNAERNGQ